MSKRFGFTLAEVLITLGIIGVVAAMTIPTLITNHQQRSMATAANVFTRKLAEALKVMNSQSALAGHASTEEFIEELSRHFKISKICENSNLSNCFVSEFTAGDEVIDTSLLKLSKNLNSANDFGTNVVGVQFASGVSALIAYNPNCTQDPYSNQIVGVSGQSNNIGLSTDAISILYDVTSGNNPNVFTNDKDIRGINVALQLQEPMVCTAELDDGTCVYLMGYSYSALDCSSANSTSSDYAKYCGNSPSGSTTDYWAGAQKACDDIGMVLPDYSELVNLKAANWEGKPTTGHYFSATEYNTQNSYNKYFGSGGDSYTKLSQNGVICVE